MTTNKLIFTLITFFSIINSLLGQRTLSVEAIWKDQQFKEKSYEGFNGMNDGEHFSRLNADDNAITIHSYKKNNEQGTVLVGQSDLKINGKTIKIASYEFSDDEKKLLILSNQKAIYRRSYTAEYYVFDLKSKKLEYLDSTKMEATLARFSPDGTKIAFVHKNNIYIRDIVSKTTLTVTKDGKSNAIINGTSDWVYEEEFSITQCFDWSFDSKKIAYLRFDEEAVKQSTIDYYKGNYPTTVAYKYPKSGEDNAKVTLHIFDLARTSSLQVKLNEYEYLPRLKWAPTESVLIAQTLNRHQNTLDFYSINGESGLATPFYQEKSITYVEIDDNLIILPNGKEILRTSEIDGYNHIYVLNLNGTQKAITSGEYDVIELYGINPKATHVFYSAAVKGPHHKGVYSSSLVTKEKKILSEELGNNTAVFAKGMRYFVLKTSNANTPPTSTLRDSKGKEICILENNTELKNTLKTYNLTRKEFFKIQGEGGQLYAWIMKPVDFNPEKKYPVYVSIYGGPGHNTVSDSWGGNDYMYHQLLTQSGYIVVSVDPRGTLYRGAAHKKSTYLQMGKYELADFMSAASYLGSLAYVDKDRIGIQGWSYGGFMTSLAMTKGAPLFKMGIAVAPVTNWKYYDNIYTERFMRTPKENINGYEDNSPITHAGKLKGKYMLIHGTADDNVHFQNAMEFTNALIKENIQFDQFSYPNKNHGIYGGNTRNHLYSMMYQYTLKNL